MRLFAVAQGDGWNFAIRKIKINFKALKLRKNGIVFQKEEKE